MWCGKGLPGPGRPRKGPGKVQRPDAGPGGQALPEQLHAHLVITGFELDHQNVAFRQQGLFSQPQGYAVNQRVPKERSIYSFQVFHRGGGMEVGRGHEAKSVPYLLFRGRPTGLLP